LRFLPSTLSDRYLAVHGGWLCEEGSARGFEVEAVAV